jgi:hypothetical protein
MQSPGSLGLASLFVVCCSAFFGIPALAAAPTFTVAAADVTMPSGGNIASSQFTLTSVNGYAGQVRVDCAYSGGAMGAKVPNCGIFVNPTHTLTANQTVNGSLTLVPFGKMVGYGAAALHRENSRSTAPVLAAALAGFFLLGRRLRSRARGWLLLVVLAGVGLAGMTSCASGMSGTFPYTVTAVDIKTNVSVSAPFTVTVP